MSRSVPLASDDGPLGRLASHVRTPLFGGAYALILSSATTSVLGLLYWTLAARLYDTHDVGMNAAAISTMTFISYLAQLNLAGVLTRFIPTAGPATRRLVLGAYTAATLLSGLAASAFVLLLAGITSPALTLVTAPAGAAWFVVATMAWSVFSLQDGALTGLRRTVWVPVENTAFAIAKIVLLLLFVSTLEDNGIFASWTIPAALLLVPVNLAIFGRFVKAHAARALTTAPEIQLGRLLPYLAGDYVGSLFVSATVGLLPLIVLSVVGASGSAYFYVAWTIAYSLQLISINMATSLMVEGSARRDNLARDSQHMLRLLFRLQLPAVAAVVIAAPLILQIFGGSYAAAGEDLLRLLALAVIPHGINAIFLSVARVRRQVGRIVLVQAATAGLALSLSVVLLGRLGIAGVGVAWLVAQGTVAVIVAATQLAPLWSRPGAVIDPWPDVRGASDGAPPGLVDRLVAALDGTTSGWALLRSDAPEPSAGDVDVLVAPGDSERLGHELLLLGFMPLPGRGRGTHRFFLGRDPATGQWVNLDLVTELAYGRFFELRAPVASEVFARRVADSGGARLAADDAFWTLILHCVLDKRAVSPRHAARLQRLVDDARDDGPAGSFVLTVLPPGWNGDRVRAAVRAAAWPSLLELRPSIHAAWRRRDRIGTAWRSATRAVLRLLEPALLLGRRRGVSVALLGPDGAGKSTLAAAIAEDFGLPVRRIYMGMWAKAHRSRIPGLDIVLRPFAIWRRYLVARFHVAVGRVVIFDRYTYDALIPPSGALVLAKRPYFWALAHLVPAPDLVFVLDAPGAMLHARKQEFDPERLESDRALFRSLVGRVPNVVVVDASQGPGAVQDEVIERIWRRTAGGPDAAAGGPGRGGPIGRVAVRAAVRVEQRRRRLLGRPLLTRALAELPAILDSLPTDRRAPAAGWQILWADRSETGVAVAAIGSEAGGPSLIVKMARQPEACEALSTHVARLADLRSDSRLEGWTDLVPEVLGTGRAGDLTFVAETALPGVAAQSMVRDPGIRRVLLPAAGAAIGELHRRTATEIVVDRAVLDAWVERPLQQLGDALARKGDPAESARRLELLGRRLGDGLSGRALGVGWIHGDYWLGNVLATPDGGRVGGIIDWDQAGDGLPAMHDVVHLILYTRRQLRGAELGDVVRGLLGGEPLDDVERAAVAAAGFEWPDRDEVRLEIALSWLRYVGAFVGLPRHGSNSLWVRRNVDAVLRDLVPAVRP